MKHFFCSCPCRNRDKQGRLSRNLKAPSFLFILPFFHQGLPSILATALFIVFLDRNVEEPPLAHVLLPSSIQISLSGSYFSFNISFFPTKRNKKLVALNLVEIFLSGKQWVWRNGGFGSLSHAVSCCALSINSGSRIVSLRPWLLFSPHLLEVNWFPFKLSALRCPTIHPPSPRFPHPPGVPPWRRFLSVYTVVLSQSTHLFRESTVSDPKTIIASSLLESMLLGHYSFNK